MASWFHRLSTPMNMTMKALLKVPVIGDRMQGSMCTLSYTGRKSGRPISTIVSYQRTDTGATIEVMMADKKTWWKNFRSGNQPLSLTIRDVTYSGTGHVRTSDDGKTWVDVTLDRPLPAS